MSITQIIGAINAIAGIAVSVFIFRFPLFRKNRPMHALMFVCAAGIFVSSATKIMKCVSHFLSVPVSD